MSTLIIKLDEANTDRILDVLGDELVRGNIGAYHLLIEDGTPLDPTDGSPHLAPERDEARLYAAAPELAAVCEKLVYLWGAGIRPQVIKGMLREEQEFAQLIDAARAAIAKATNP